MDGGNECYANMPLAVGSNNSDNIELFVLNILQIVRKKNLNRKILPFKINVKGTNKSVEAYPRAE